MANFGSTCVNRTGSYYVLWIIMNLSVMIGFGSTFITFALGIMLGIHEVMGDGQLLGSFHHVVVNGEYCNDI